MFSQLLFVGVACDEGTTKGIHDLDFVMENPLSGLQPYPCYTSVMKNGKAIQYTEHLARGLDYLRIHGIPVGSVTVDGNTAQIKAQLKALSLASFIIDLADQISQFKTFNIDEIIDLHKLLTILKSLTLIFEDPQTPHFYAFRIIGNAISALEELEKEVQYAKDVKIELIKYCQLSADAGVWMLSYILTPEGRRDFSKRIKKKKLPKIPKTGFMPMFKVGEKKEKEDIELVYFLIENIDIPPNEEDCTNDPINFLAPKEEEEENNFQNAFVNEIPEIEEEEDQYEIINEVYANDIQFEEHHYFKCEDIIEEEEETEENNDNDNDNDNANEKEHSHFVENEEEEEEEEEGEEDNENKMFAQK